MLLAHRRTLMLASVLAALGVSALALVGDGGFTAVDKKQRQLDELRRERDRARDQARRFEKRVDLQSADLAEGALVTPHREKLIREELGVIGDDEVEVILR